MSKYLGETLTVSNSYTVVRQLVRTNVILKEHADKQMTEKRQIRKKLIQTDSLKNDADKLCEKKEIEIKTLQKLNEKLKGELHLKDLEIKNFKEKMKMYENNASRRDQANEDAKENFENQSFAKSFIINDTLNDSPLVTKSLDKSFRDKLKRIESNEDSDIQYMDEIMQLEIENRNKKMVYI